MSGAMPALMLTGHGYRIVVDPNHGANVLGLSWRNREGRDVDILRRCVQADLVAHRPSPVGCFPMAPFANRIDQGRFAHRGRSHALEIDQPAENVAIHGLSRFASFETLSHAPEFVALLHRHRGDVFAYDLLQTVAIDADGVTIALSLTNRGDTLPFGIGLHPYFAREPGARLRFAAADRSESCARHLPLRFGPASTPTDFSAGADLDGLQGLDAHFSNWAPRKAVLERPKVGACITVAGSGAFANLHLYVGPDRDHVCIEPVSHVPDVHNRRDLARYGDVACLRDSEALTGSMRIDASELCS